MLERIMLGSTDIEVSRLGLGTVKLGRNQAVKYPSEFQLPSDQQVSDLLDTALELGINLVDTAPAYGSSEERLGKLINDRERWVISTKVGEEFQDGKSTFDFSAAHTRKSIERSLARLNTHYLDIVLIHSNGDDRKILESSGCLPVLRELKSDNVINAIGISTKSLDGGLLALDLVDLVMVTYNTTEQEQAPVLEKARKLNKGVFIKKGFASGYLNSGVQPGVDPVELSLRNIFQFPGVSSLITGTINPDHLRQNVQTTYEVLANIQ